MSVFSQMDDRSAVVSVLKKNQILLLECIRVANLMKTQSKPVFSEFLPQILQSRDITQRREDANDPTRISLVLLLLHG